MASRGMYQANMDLRILQEKKLTDGIYTRGSAGYSVIATNAPSRHRSGVALFYRSKPHFVVEAVEKFGPNVLGFQIATGAQQWYIVGVYTAPEDTETMERVVEAIARHQQLRAPWLPPDLLLYPLHRLRVLGRDVHPHDVPLSRPRR